MEEIVLVINYEEQDIVSAVKEYYNSSHIKLYMFYTFAFSMLGVFVAFLPEMFFLGYTVAIIMGMTSLYYYSAYFNLPQKMFERNRDFYGKTITFRFSEEEIYCLKEDSQTQMEWSYYKKVRETRDSYILFHDTDFLSIIPKRIFSNPREEFEFKELLKRKIKSYTEIQGIFTSNDKIESKPEKYLPPDSPPDWR